MLKVELESFISVYTHTSSLLIKNKIIKYKKDSSKSL